MELNDHNDSNIKIWKLGFVENDESYSLFLMETLKTMQNVESVLQWRSAEEYWRDPSGQQLDLLFVDIGLPGMSGTELVSLISQRNPDVRMVMLTAVQTDEEIFSSLRYGAIGYILKSDVNQFKEVIEQLMDGGAVITPSIAARVLTTFRTENKLHTVDLTKRERQVLGEIVNGLSTGEIASLFGTSDGTVRNHIKRIYKKLHVKSRVELMKKAKELGLY